MWIEVEVGAEVLIPRTALTAAPFAMGLSLPIVAEAEVSESGAAGLEIRNTSTAGANYGIRGVSGSTNGRGVYGEALSSSGLTCGVYGISRAGDGRGVYGEAVNETGHLGPMAQDFYDSFGLGSDNKGIATVDADGVALAAFRGL